MIMSTQRRPVRGSVHWRTILGAPLAVCSIVTTTRFTPATRSIAPPMPLTILPGTIQFARSPSCEICIAPRMHRSTCPPRIIAKESADEKKLAPVRAVTVCLPALMRSASTSAARGKGPIPNRPFSDCSQTSIPAGTQLATSVGIPIPRLTI